MGMTMHSCRSDSLVLVRRECEWKGRYSWRASPKKRPVVQVRRFPDVLARQRYGGLADLSDVEVPSLIGWWGMWGARKLEEEQYSRTMLLYQHLVGLESEARYRLYCRMRFCVCVRAPLASLPGRSGMTWKWKKTKKNKNNGLVSVDSTRRNGERSPALACLVPPSVWLRLCLRTIAHLVRFSIFRILWLSHSAGISISLCWNWKSGGSVWTITLCNVYVYYTRWP